MYRSILLVALCAILAASPASAQRKQLCRFSHEFSPVAETHRIGLSFLPLRIVSWFIPKSAFNGDAKDIKWALKKVRSMKVYTIEMDKGKKIPDESIRLLKEELAREAKFEPLMEVRHKGSNVHFLSRSGNDDRLDHLVLLVQDEGEMVMLHLKTRFTMKDLQYLVSRFKDQI